MDRRDFIKLLGQAGVGAGLVGCGKSSETASNAIPWGTPPPGLEHLLIPKERRPEGVLDLYLMGGICPWDTFYVVPEHGKEEKNFWWTFQEKRQPHHATVEEYFETCDGGSRDLYEPFAVDAKGQTVNLGPWVYPLRDRPDILKRMRVMVLRHVFEPHGVASPFALCGHPRGTPRMACTGAHVERYYQPRSSALRRTPHSYVLYSMDSEIAAQFDIHSAASTGLHPAAVRPLSLRLSPDNPLPSQLAREHLGGLHEATDDAVQFYLQRFKNALKFGGKSRALEELFQARQAMRFSGDLIDVLTPELLAPLSGQECGFDAPNGMDTTATGLRLAVDLLTRDTARAKHVNFIDSGLINALGAGYDTHDYHVKESSRNVVHTCRLLSEYINKPGEDNPQKLDLDKHTILLTTEFGRTPYIEIGKEEGLDHWPYGYVVVAIGGFVDEERSGVVGAINSQGYANTNPSMSFSPSEFRASMLMTMGIWPFDNEAFAVGDTLHPLQTREQTAAYLRQEFLGYKL